VEYVLMDQVALVRGRAAMRVDILTQRVAIAITVETLHC
jgi:hypothetical protein